eukprot:TRINITY_DN4083_c0_g1_i1.p1 TRINITY_DN4083_c0_g1~~TRINITY_DN4083_c0_g1_i1.p1  ORF type:complete len:402 (-),score=131.47 TRINITY_DN4083_c0_g1_i1:612-1817(-)
MNIQFCSLFPQDASIKDAAGLPVGATLQPLAPLDKDQQSVQLDIEEVARCEQCFGYINPFVLFDRRRWRCTFCNTYNPTPPRYATPMLRRELPELSAPTVELELQGEGSALAQEQPLNLLLVDLSGDGQYLEMVKAGLQAAIDVMPGSGFVGLLGFSDTVGVYDLRSPVPHVRELQLAEDGYPVVELHELVSLETIAVQLEPHRDNLSEAIDSLVVPDQGCDKRAFGPALSSVVQFLKLQSELVSCARVTCFLSGLPNHGAGQLSTEYSEGQELRPQSDFYQSVGTLAASLGVAIDVLAGCSSFCALPTVRGAVEPTGGVLALYEEQQSMNITEDIYNLLSRPQAFNGLLRLRCPGALQVAHAYGNWTQDKQHNELHHMAVLDEHRSFGFDLEFSNSTHFK